MNELIARILQALIGCAAGDAWCQVMTPNPQAAGYDASEPVYAREAYDLQADAFRDLDTARVMAGFYERRILIEVGGDWCAWSQILDRYLETNDDVRAEFAESFVILKVHWSRDEPNEAFLSQYLEIPGYPHFFVLDADGSLLRSQSTVALENGEDSYSSDAMIAFAREWRRPNEP